MPLGRWLVFLPMPGLFVWLPLIHWTINRDNHAEHPHRQAVSISNPLAFR